MTDNRFSQGAQNALLLAFSSARRLQHSFIGSEHLLLGIYCQRGGGGSRALCEMGLTERQLFDAVAAVAGAGKGRASAPVVLTVSAMRIIEGAPAQATAAGSASVGSEHILMSLLTEKDCGGALVLKRLGISLSVQGARQTGKTYIIERFAEDNYEELLEINFKQMVSAVDIFSGDLTVDNMVMAMRFRFPEKKILQRLRQL